jgi:sulfoxide reductase heme-binding subunit YedZ
MLSATTVAAGSDPRALWYLSRGTGMVSLVLLSLTMALGLLQAWRIVRPGLGRLVVVAVHRNAALLGVGLLVVHIGTAIADPYVSLRIVDAVVPFVSSYRPFWVGLGALSFDTMVVVIVTSLVRDRLTPRVWRAVHWASYGLWPMAVLHGWRTGTDTRIGWVAAIYVICAAVVVGATAARLLRGRRPEPTPAMRTERRLATAATTRRPLTTKGSGRAPMSGPRR